MLNRPRSLIVEVGRNLLPLAILLGALSGFMGLFSLRTPPADVQPAEALPEVTTEALREHTGGFEIELDGLVVPHREVALSAEVSGRIVSKSPDCRAGRYVRAGEQLLRIDSQDYDLDVQRLEAQRQQAQAAILEVDKDLLGTLELVKLSDQDVKLQQRELQRELSLAAVNSEAERERAERNLLAAQNALVKMQNQYQVLLARKTSLEASLRLAEAQLARAELDQERTRVLAPLDGMIVEEMVQQDHFVQKGTPLLTMEDTSRAEVRCTLRLDQMYWLWLTGGERVESAQPAGLELDQTSPERDFELPQAEARVIYRLAGRDYVWDARLDRYDGIGLDERTRTIPCRIVVDKPREPRVEGGTDDAQRTGPPALMRGMFVTVRILVDPSPEAGQQLVRIPQEALRPGERVWIDRQGVLRIVPVDFIRLIRRGPAETAAVAVPDDAVQSRPGGDSTRLAGGGSPLDALVQIASDQLRPGDRLIVSPLADAHDGQRIRQSAGAETGQAASASSPAAAAPGSDRS